MVTLDDVRRIAMALPEVVEGPGGFHAEPTWKVRDKGFVWQRPLQPRDVAQLQELGERVPEGETIALRVAREEKDAVVASAGAFTIPHFNGYPAVLVELGRADPDELRELVTEAWIVQAPKRLSKAFLAGEL